MKPMEIPRRRWHTEIGLLIGLLVLSYFIPVRVLWLEGEEKKRVLWLHPVVPGCAMELCYEHSMYRVFQKEIYSLGVAGDFLLGKMVFGSFEAAAYYDPEALGRLTRSGDSWILTGISMSLPEVRFFVHESHRVILGDHAINLAAEFGEGSKVFIKLSPYPRAIFTWGLEWVKMLLRSPSPTLGGFLEF